MREIRIAAMLTHPNIVPLYDSGEIGGQLFYVMPFIEGESLRECLRRETMLPVSQVIGWASEVSDALAFAHARGIIHRDIKPENLLIQASRLVITDFGIARAIDLAAEENITSEQLVLGTPLYMSPEQASGARLDGRTDIYSLACVVYEMLTGEPPFGGATPQAVTAKKLAGHYPRVRVIRPMVSREIEQALSRALTANPADRFANPEEFAESLRARAKTKAGSLVPWFLALGLIGGALVIAVTRTGRRTLRERPRIVVSVFENRTGDPRNDPLGFMAADWITEGLHRTGAVDVVPTSTAMAAARSLRALSDTVDPVQGMARETGATLVASGAIYRDQDSLVFQAQIANTAGGKLVGAVEPLRTGQAQSVEALKQLRTRLMGLLALSMDDRVINEEQPPTYDAYKAFSEGMNAYVRNDYGQALAAFERAYTEDTTFVLPLLYASFCHVNRRERAQGDSVLRIVARQRGKLNEYDRDWLDYQRAELAGNDSDALEAIRRAAELAPSSKATYNFAATAFEARQPFPAESALRQLSPDTGPMRGWFPYWDILTSALHAQGKYKSELAAATEARRQFPQRVEGFISEARALAAEQRSAELERLWQEANAKLRMTPEDVSNLAYETGSELWAHGSSNNAQAWFTRALDATVSRDSSGGTIATRWLRARTAYRLGRLREALDLGQSLATDDPTRSEYYLGFLGVLAAQSGDSTQAEALLQRLAGDKRPYTLGVPQFEAGRIAAVLGETERATELFVFALDRGYPYTLEFHRDPALSRVRNLPIMRQLDARGH
jgi:TolB-like protein